LGPEGSAWTATPRSVARSTTSTLPSFLTAAASAPWIEIAAKSPATDETGEPSAALNVANRSANRTDNAADGHLSHASATNQRGQSGQPRSTA